MPDVYADELFSPNFHITSAQSTSNPAPTMTLSPQDDVFSQRLEAANSQYPTTPYDAQTQAKSFILPNQGTAWFCPERDCLRWCLGFDSEESLQQHTQEEHPLKYAQEEIWLRF
jgi:hypothetical protein